jgi:hypothetical protein
MTVSYEELDAVLKLMGATKDSRPIQQEPGSEREKVQLELKSGIQIAAKDFDEIPVVAGMFSHNGEHAFLYIDEPRHPIETLQENPAENAQRFHLVKNCSTLIHMHNAGRSERYVLIQNATGTFPTKPFDLVTHRTLTDQKIDARLLPCKNCLNELRYQGYQRPHYINAANDKIWRNFSVKEFFDHYEPFFFTENYYRAHADNGTANYTLDHAKVRDRLLQEVQFTCEDCGVKLEDRKDLLHLHHINGQRGDNRRTNTTIVCVVCHCAKPLHGHMKGLLKSTDALFIRQRLSRQNNNR